MRGLWYSCCPTTEPWEARCSVCRQAVLATPLPPAHQILCDRCFDRRYTEDEA
jgi:hypothetical protein